MTASLLLAIAVITEQTTAAALPMTDLPRKEVWPLFTPLEHRFTGGGYTGKVYRYRLFEPAYGSSGEKYPLIVWLHGIGEVEIDGLENLGQLKWLGSIFKTARREDYPFFLLAMQCPTDKRVWSHSAGDGKTKRLNSSPTDKPLLPPPV